MEKLKLIIILCCVTLVVSSVVFLATSCSWTGEQVVSDETLQESYEKLYLGSASQEELVASLVEFEVTNPNHFKSKLDLAQWYFSLGDHVLSWQYLQRALSLANESGFRLEFKDFSGDSDDSFIISNQISQLNIPDGLTDIDLELLHRLLAYLCLFRDDVQGAEKYSKTSLALSEYHFNSLENPNIASSLYLMGQVMFSLAEDEDFSQKDTMEKALGNFDRAYTLNPQGLASIHLLGYGKLLAQVQRTNEAEFIVEEFLKINSVNPDTLLIAQEIYTNTNNTYKERICNFLAEDYVLGILSLDDKNLISETNWISEYKKLIDSVEEKNSKTNSEHSGGNQGENVYLKEKFFGETYCQVSLRSKEGRITRGDLDSLVAVEPYFVNFPSYYWLLWSVAKELGDSEVFIPALKKIIALNPTGIYAKAARQELQNLVVTQANKKEGTSSLFDAILF